MFCEFLRIEGKTVFIIIVIFVEFLAYMNSNKNVITIDLLLNIIHWTAQMRSLEVRKYFNYLLNIIIMKETKTITLNFVRRVSDHIITLIVSYLY